VEIILKRTKIYVAIRIASAADLRSIDGLCAGCRQARSRNGDDQGETASDPGRRGAQQ
jgi:hypothetical protein